MSTKGTKRKNAAAFADEHEQFLMMIAEKRPELEIAVCLKLSSVQLQAHVLEALKKQEVIPDDLKPSYEAVYAKSLPKVIRKQMSLDSDDDGEALVKVQLQDDRLLLTLLRSIPPRQEQPGPEHKDQPPVTLDTDEDTV